MGSHSIPQEIFLTPGIEPTSPALQADSLPVELPDALQYMTDKVAACILSLEAVIWLDLEAVKGGL